MIRCFFRKSLLILLSLIGSAAANEYSSSRKCASQRNNALVEVVKCKLGAEAIRVKGGSAAVVTQHDRNCETRFIQRETSKLSQSGFCHQTDPRQYLDDALESVRTEVSRISSIPSTKSPTVIAAQPLQVTIVNNLPTQSACSISEGANSLSVFVPNQATQTVKPGKSLLISGPFTGSPGVGIQINNWYWTRHPHPVEELNPQNPDNSGGQFWFVDQTCNQLMHTAAWFGDGIQTYRVSAVSGSNQAGCKITVAANDYTDSVTPGCCSYKNCPQGSYGQTNNGLQWPPPPPSDLK